MLMLLFDGFLNWGPGDYRLHLSIVAHVCVVQGAANVVISAVAVMISDVTFAPSAAYALGLVTGTGPAATIARALDLTTLWGLVASAIAVASVRRKAASRAVAAVLIGYALLTIVFGVLGRCY